MPLQGESERKFAVVKKSSDPHNDFRTSMVEMIVEKQIFSAKYLEQLLQCFLSLNSHHHHKVIVEVFTEKWTMKWTFNFLLIFYFVDNKNNPAAHGVSRADFIAFVDHDHWWMVKEEVQFLMNPAVNRHPNFGEIDWLLL
ncbi:hypothetical protein FEM48_Zijuj12G0029800 [Ziziphus jujuba var. spinosa]|uniref:Transcription repressor n=1 Tax=Ziziphus jujuba var. spinosa TaxID=714518 RepID=A0A978UAT7_ZIZJJ|nr:hypothetical protein FEM48_Zijuj12G0029800 [Ziziphus jujuba var. spinosa]